MGSDDESASDDESRRTAGHALDSVPVEIEGPDVAKLRCKLCCAKATENSPLALSTDMSPAPMEWRLYSKNKIRGKIVSKVPRGRLCNWCTKTFFTLGWEDEYSSIGAYAKTIATTNKEKHQGFLTSRKAVIKHHLKSASGPGCRPRMTSSAQKDVNDAFVTLDTVTAETRRMAKPKMQFVTIESWDDKLDGKFDASKVIEENCFGKRQKGIWKKVGREGVYDAEHFEDKVVEERTRETDDSGPLGGLRMDHKREKLRSLIDNHEKTQKEAAVDGPPTVSTAQDLLSLLSSVGLAKGSASGVVNGDEPSSSSTSSSSDSDNDEHAADAAAGSSKARLELFCNGGRKRPVGSASGSVTGSAHGSGESARGKPGNAARDVAKKSAASKKSGSARGPDDERAASRPLPSESAHEAVSMDGRVKRLRDSLEKEGKDVETKIRTLLMAFWHDEEKCVWDDPTSREKTKKALAEMKKEVVKLGGQQKIATRRFEKASPSGQQASGEAKRLFDANTEFLDVILRFLNLLLMSQAPLDDFSAAMDDMSIRGIRFTKSLHKYAYWLKARSLMLFERYDELCEMSSDKSMDLEKLFVCKIPRDDVKEYASIVLQQCISERITALKEEQVGRPLAEYIDKKAAVDMLEQVKNNLVRDGFAGACILSRLNKWIAALDLPNADPDVLSELVADHAAAPDEFLPTDILGQLMHTTKIGTRLLDSAAAWLKDEGEQIHVKRRLTKVDSLMEQILLQQPTMVSMADLRDESVNEPDYMSFLNVHVVPIEKLVEEVLEHDSVSDKVALKKNKKLASMVKKLSDRRTELWDFVRREFLAYAKEAVLTITRIVSEAIEKNGEAQVNGGYELINTVDLRCALMMPGLEDHPVVSHRVEDNASKIAFCSEVNKYKTFATTLSQIVIGVLRIKVEKIRTLCGGTVPTVSELREWCLFDVDSVMEYSRDSVDGIRALLMVVKNEFVKMSFSTFTVVKDMVDLFAKGQGLSVAPEQIERVTHELEDLVEIAGEQAEDHLRSVVDFCVKFLKTFAATLALTAKSSPDERSQCVAALKWLQTHWPLADHKESAASGLNSNDVKDAVANEAVRLQKSMEESMKTTLSTVQKHIKACTKLLGGLDIDEEAGFRKQMAGSAAKLATAVQKLKVVSDQVKEAYKNQGLSFAEEQGELHREVQEVGQNSTYHIAVYAALTLYRDTHTWATTLAAKKALANLKQAMNALNNAPELVALEIKYNHRVVAEMRAELKMPRPSIAATVSDPTVSLGSEPTGSVATVSDPAESAAPATEVSAPAKEAPALKKRKVGDAKPKQARRRRVAAAEPGEGLKTFLARARGTASTGEVAGAIETSATGADDLNEDDIFDGFNESAAEEREELNARKDADGDEELYEEKGDGEAA